MLSLKMAEAAAAASITGEHPVMLLDDVLSELDDGRKQYLLTRMREKAGQFFLSVGHKRTELAQAVESGARQDLAGGVKDVYKRQVPADADTGKPSAQAQAHDREYDAQYLSLIHI